MPVPHNCSMIDNLVGCISCQVVQGVIYKSQKSK